MDDGQKSERVQIVMAPGDLRAIAGWLFARPVSSRSEATRRLIRLGFEADEAPANAAAMPAGGRP